jgi:hypothetical protein
VTFPIIFLPPPVFLASAFQSSIGGKSAASLQTASYHLSLGFPTGLLVPKNPLITFLEGRKIIFAVWPAIKESTVSNVCRNFFFSLTSEF